MLKFDRSGQSDDFRRWMVDHPTGYYLNARGRQAPMLHHVGCIHLGDGEGYNTTTSAKLAFHSLADLDAWKRKNLPFHPCSTCMRGSRGR